MNPSRSSEHDFAKHLETYASSIDRGALAALRRGLGKRPGEAPEMFPFVVPWVPGDVYGWREEVYYIVASLFALHPVSWTHVPDGAHNLGASLSVISAKKEESADAVDRRFVALLNAHRDDLSEHLRFIVSLCAGKEAPIDWTALLHDLARWDLPQRSVQRAWARRYWTTPQNTVDDSTSGAEPDLK